MPSGAACRDTLNVLSETSGTAEFLGPGGTVAILLEAARSLGGGSAPTLLADAGSENANGEVDALVEAGLLRRVRAQTEVVFSDALLEAWWRSLKHNWLFLHPLESLARVRSLVAFYVAEHDATIPHSAFQGQTPDEVYFGTGDHVPEMLAARRRNAREVRLAENRAARCGVCSA